MYRKKKYKLEVIFDLFSFFLKKLKIVNAADM